MANHFTWYQLMTTHPGEAARFYASVVGWTAQEGQGPAQDYTVFEAAGEGVGGAMALPELARQAGAPPHWTGYIGVDSVESMLECLQGAGGTVHHAAEDIPGIGRFAVVADPQGAAFMLFRWENGVGPNTPAAGGGAGHCGWHELHTTDWQAASGFYSSLFGWTKTDAMDMGPMGTYQMFEMGDGVTMGGMFNKRPDVPMPAWLFYFNVPEINAAMARVTEGGGQVLNGPVQVPGGTMIAQCRDPQGAMFALAAPPK